MRFERGARRRRTIGLTPLIDVVFLLLIFFMLASHFDREALLPLTVLPSPESTTLAEAPDSDPLVVEIAADGRAHIGGQRVVGADLAQRAAAAARAERPIRVRPASEADLQSIVDVLGAIASSGARDVALERRD